MLKKSLKSKKDKFSYMSDPGQSWSLGCPLAHLKYFLQLSGLGSSSPSLEQEVQLAGEKRLSDGFLLNFKLFFQLLPGKYSEVMSCWFYRDVNFMAKMNQFVLDETWTVR